MRRRWGTEPRNASPQQIKPSAPTWHLITGIPPADTRRLSVRMSDWLAELRQNLSYGDLRCASHTHFMRLHRRRAPHARARDRRQHRDLQRHQRRPPATAAIRAAGPPDRGLREQHSEPVAAESALRRRLPGLPPAEPALPHQPRRLHQATSTPTPAPTPTRSSFAACASRRTCFFTLPTDAITRPYVRRRRGLATREASRRRLPLVRSLAARDFSGDGPPPSDATSRSMTSRTRSSVSCMRKASAWATA